MSYVSKSLAKNEVGTLKEVVTEYVTGQYVTRAYSVDIIDGNVVPFLCREEQYKESGDTKTTKASCIAAHTEAAQEFGLVLTETTTQND
jgi:hypothetical protein